MARSKSPAGGKGTRANKIADATKEQGVNPVVEAGVGVSASETNSSDVGVATAYKPQGDTKAQPKPTTEATNRSEIDTQTTAKPPAETKPEAKAESHKLEVMKTDGRKNLVPINLEDEIRRRAYELYQQRGAKGGSEAEDWLAAEREIRQRYRQQSA
jgi:Protein of unknown function (DUF2934)